MGIRRWCIMLLAVMLALLPACKKADKLMDGYYTAEQAEYSHGWKEFVTICVNNGEVVTVEYNAKNASGFIKSWDMAYMRNMNGEQGTYPNRYTRTYAANLLQAQDAGGIEMVAGASTSGGSFTKLAAALLEKAKAGDTSLAIVQTGG